MMVMEEEQEIKRIPDIIFELKENLRVEFLKGLADGDSSGN